MSHVFRPENQPDYPTPAAYVAACREHFERCVMLPWPTCRSELLALHRYKPDWARIFGEDTPREWWPDSWFSEKPI